MSCSIKTICFLLPLVFTFFCKLWNMVPQEMRMKGKKKLVRTHEISGVHQVISGLSKQYHLTSINVGEVRSVCFNELYAFLGYGLFALIRRTLW